MALQAIEKAGVGAHNMSITTVNDEEKRQNSRVDANFLAFGFSSPDIDGDGEITPKEQAFYDAYEAEKKKNKTHSICSVLGALALAAVTFLAVKKGAQVKNLQQKIDQVADFTEINGCVNKSRVMEVLCG